MDPSSKRIEAKSSPHSSNNRIIESQKILKMKNLAPFGCFHFWAGKNFSKSATDCFGTEMVVKMVEKKVGTAQNRTRDCRDRRQLCYGYATVASWQKGEKENNMR